MALLKTLSLKNNFNELSVFEDAYTKVFSVTSDKSTGEALVHIFKGPSKESLLKSFTVKFDIALEGKNFIAQAYDAIKALPEYSDAVDC